MASTYADWRTAFDAAAAAFPGLVARRMILEGEGRVPGAHAAFLARLTDSFDARIAAGEASETAAIGALVATLRSIEGDPTFNFLISRSEPAYDKASTHVTARYLSRFGTFGDIDDDAGAPPRLPVRFADAFPPPKRSVWFSPDRCPDGPDEVAKDLGLPHFEGQISYRIDVDTREAPQFVPTCFDAGLFEAWQGPPAGHTGACGVTRHLETGERIHNEFVVPTEDVPAQRVTLVRLPTGGGATRVGRLRPDYLVRR